MEKICTFESCDRPFLARGYCSMHYDRVRRTGTPHRAPRQIRSAEERMFAKVEKTESCWLWGGYLTEDGYGIMWDGARASSVHRVSWEIANGKIPEGMEIDHICHARSCIRPDHLRLATRAINNRNLSGIRKNSTSGHRGVFWSKKHGMWRARVQKDKRGYEAGLFHSLEEAAEAAQRKRRELFEFNPADYKEVA